MGIPQIQKRAVFATDHAAFLRDDATRYLILSECFSVLSSQECLFQLIIILEAVLFGHLTNL